MSKVIYGVVDTEKNIGLNSDIPTEDLLLDAYDADETCKKDLEEMLQANWEAVKAKGGPCDYKSISNDFLYDYLPDSAVTEYLDLDTKVGLVDLGFSEKAWQSLMVGFDNKKDFPAKNLCLISIEALHHESLQRVDLLYLRTDGRIIPVEIKVSKNGKDAHGQIIRYMAGFAEKNYDIKNILLEAEKKVPHNVEIIKSFIKENKITDKKVKVIKTSGILICEQFHDDTLRAIRYLNEETNMDIKMFDIDVFVKKGWTKETTRFIYRIELSEVV